MELMYWNTERPSLPSGVCLATLPYSRFKVFSTSSSSFWVQEFTTLKEFNDGLSGIIDFEDKITTDHREIIRELVDKNRFNKIKVERHTLCWENGVDFAPEYLYDQIKIRQEIA
jgi:hypothetical protein